MLREQNKLKYTAVYVIKRRDGRVEVYGGAGGLTRNYLNILYSLKTGRSTILRAFDGASYTLDPTVKPLRYVKLEQDIGVDKYGLAVGESGEPFDFLNYRISLIPHNTLYYDVSIVRIPFEEPRSIVVERAFKNEKTQPVTVREAGLVAELASGADIVGVLIARDVPPTEITLYQYDRLTVYMTISLAV